MDMDFLATNFIFENVDIDALQETKRRELIFRYFGESRDGV